MARCLVVLTAQYPYGTGETFLEAELPVLAKTFDKVLLVPYKQGEGLRPLPDNVELLQLEVTNNALRKDAIRAWRRQLGWSRNRWTTFRQFRYLTNHLFNMQPFGQALSRALEKADLNSEDTLLYAYWFDLWVGAVLQTKSLDKFPMVARAHGYDLYDYRHVWGFIPFRELYFSRLMKLYTVSEDGRRHLLEALGPPAPIEVARLGTKDHGVNPTPSETTYRIVTCASLIPLKRVGMMIDILKSAKSNIEWVHFGDGTLRREIEDRRSELPPNINMIFKGSVSNAEIHEFYRNTPIDLFLNTSEFEGVPVSIMEAISYGIPALAPNVGGVGEVVTDGSGLLFDKDESAEKICELMEQMLVGKSRDTDYRKQVKSFWAANFSDHNFQLFANQLMEI